MLRLQAVLLLRDLGRASVKGRAVYYDSVASSALPKPPLNPIFSRFFFPSFAVSTRGRVVCPLPTSSISPVFDEDVYDVYDFTGPVLGSGAFATVLRVKDRMSGVEYAIKQVSTALTCT